VLNELSPGQEQYADSGIGGVADVPRPSVVDRPASLMP